MKTQHNIIVRAFLLLLALGLFGISASAATVTLWNVKGNGRSAEAQFSDAIPSGGGSILSGGGRINVFQNGGSAFLFYEIWGNDPSSRFCTDNVDQFGNVITICVYTRFNYDSGWGLIPTNDIQFTATGADLSTTTGPSFSTTRCTTDSSGPTPTTNCVSGTPVTFDLTWTSNDLSSYVTEGETKQAFDSFRFKSEGTVRATSAYVTGTADGHSFTNAPGRLGDTKGKNVATEVVP
jgi:hypothetical protein